MKQFNSILAVAAAAVMGFSGAYAASAEFGAATTGRVPAQFLTEHHGRQYNGRRPFDVDKVTPFVGNSNRAKVVGQEPVLSFNGLPQYDYLQGPDGSIWFYTAEYDTELIYHNPYWTEEVLHGFKFTIYDSSFNKVGEVSDDIELLPGETRAREVVIDPAVSTKFFNTDDKLEIMVLHVMNTEVYVNHYYNKVYSIGGEKDEKGYDVSIATYEGRCVDSTNLGAGTGEENYFYTFVKDPVVDSENHKTSDPDYVDYINTLTYDLTTYTKATETAGPSLIFEKAIYGTRIPGDTTDGIYLISKVFDGKLYMVYSQYDKPYFVNPLGGATDESATPDNSLKIEVYATAGQTPELVSTTLIPVEYIEDDDNLIYTFYSIGSLTWTNDVDMIVNGTPQAPAFIVAHQIVYAASMEDILSNYEIYDNNGRLVKVLASGAESFVIFDSSDSIEPEIMFISLDANSEYQFDFAKLYSGTKLFNIPQINGGDPLTANTDRAKNADGTYSYVFEMSNYEEGLDGNLYARVAWFDNAGNLDHIDKVNMGNDVQYGTIYVAQEVLKPNLFDTDDNMEYAVLVKRTVGRTTRNEFMVVDDDGENYAHFSADDGRGTPRVFTVLPGKTNRLMMVYDANSKFNVDLYDLPFLNKAGVDNVTVSGELALSYDGETLTAEGAHIELYTTAGVKAAEGNDTLSLKGLTPGIYVAVAANAKGEKVTAKVSF